MLDSKAIHSKDAAEYADQKANMMMGHPEVFAEPLLLPNGSEISAESQGVWKEGNRQWSVCLVTSEPGYSMSIIFSRLYLPLRSKLVVSSFDDGENLLDEYVLTVHQNGPLAGTPALRGSTLEVTYSMAGSDSQQFYTSMRPQIHILSVLRGVRPLPSFMYASGQRGWPAGAREQPIHSLSPSESFDATEKDEEADFGTVLNMTQNSSVNNNIDEIAAGAFAPEGEDEVLNEVLASRVSSLNGAGLACLQDAACVPLFRNATRATVMLLLNSPLGGRFCTGSMINGPDPSDVLIVTANHCRGSDDDLSIAILWSVVLGRSLCGKLHSDTSSLGRIASSCR